MIQRLLGLRRLLPTGRSLPEEDWARRHRQICMLLWAHVLFVPPFGLANGETLLHSVTEAAVLAVFALLATEPRFGTGTRAAMATIGLISASAVLVHLSGGLIEMHFHFFVMVVVISLYQSWLPFLLALGYVVLHHGVLGVLSPEAVYNHPAAIASPWLYALLHGSFILGQSAACLVMWRVNEEALHSERAARGALEEANLDLAEAQSLASVGSWDRNLVSGAVWWSDEMYKLTGRDPETFSPTLDAFLDSVHPDDRVRVSAIMETAVANQADLDFEFRVVRPDGTTRVLHTLGQYVSAPDGSPSSLMGTCQDITERKALEQEIEHRALHDSLTGLGNRAMFFDRTEHALAVRARSGLPLTLLYLDLDDFKTINDSLGHAAGDELLIEVGRRLLQAVRDSDTVVRLGGDEFAVLLEDTDVPGAREIADRVIDLLQAPLVIHGRQYVLQTSIGLAPAGPASRPSDLLRDADIAMYSAKRDGKASYRVFTSEMRVSVVTRLELKEELANALEREEFVLHYQPLIDLRTKQLQGVEALVRWQHPQRGLLPPAEFVPLAEETGQIVPLGAWVTHQATRQVKALQDELGTRLALSVNLSAHQLPSDIVGMVREALDDSELQPRDLVLEITETHLMSQAEADIGKLEALRAMGVRVALDDFGTGYSSLGYLRRLPIDILKIDQSFVQGAADRAEESALTQAIIKLSETLLLDTVGEGIETAEQAGLLRDLGCHSAQGYYFCRPLPPAELLEQLRGWDAHAPAATVGGGSLQHS